jgi:ATP adenylyltransferase
VEHLWAPWRVEYIQKEKPEGCILCDKPVEDKDTQNYLLYRGQNNFIMLNSFPYNTGHLMVVPYRHVASLEELTDAELHEHFEIVRLSIKILRQAYKPDGFNVGVNMGKVAGAGIDDHIHTHIVPRWQGDTNFMPVMADIKIVNEALVETYQRLKELF